MHRLDIIQSPTPTFLYFPAQYKFTLDSLDLPKVQWTVFLVILSVHQLGGWHICVSRYRTIPSAVSKVERQYDWGARQRLDTNDLRKEIRRPAWVSVSFVIL
jgi:hypothetical protein